jgi:PAS domain S-box-containing protein
MDWLKREIITQHAELRSERQLLEVLIWSLPGGVAFADKDRIYQIVNPVYAAYSGRKPEDFIGHRLNTVVPKSLETFKQATDIVYEERRSATVRRMPVDHIARKRFYVDGHASPVMDANGEFMGMLWHCFDVTDSVLLERERSRMALIVENSFDSIISTDLDGIIETWNKGAERIYGFSAADAIGHPLSMIVPSDLQPEHAGILKRITQGQRLPFFTTDRICKSGRRITIGVTISPVRDESGRVTGAAAISRDLSGQKLGNQN